MFSLQRYEAERFFFVRCPMRELLKQRGLPALQSREEMLEILQREVYGYLPEKPRTVSFEVTGRVCRNFCAGKATGNRLTAHCDLGGKVFSFPFTSVLPTDGKKHPFFIHMNFRPDVPDRYMPTEELVDAGFAVISCNYHDVVRDDADFTDGLAGCLFENGNRNATDPGKICLWAWAMHRMMDYAQTRPELEHTKGIACGHSRLGKTALFAAATDERFAMAYSNDSGCSGAALSRGKQGETVDFICNRFPYWFCENYQKYRQREKEMPFDQHFLLACIAPRCLLVGSATLDDWADPISEQLCCMAAAPAFETELCWTQPAQPDQCFLDEKLGYHLRTGTHYFSREDWHRLILFANSHL